MSKDAFLDLNGFLSVARDHFGGLVKIHFPQVVDAMHIHKAEKTVTDAAHLIAEPVLLSMGEIERFYDPQESDWLPAIDYVKRKVLDADDLRFATTMSGARWVEPEYLLDVNVGRDVRRAQLRVEVLREIGLVSIKGDWTGAQEAPPIVYQQPTEP